MHGNIIPMGSVIGLDPAMLNASEQRTVIQMQRRMLRVLKRDTKIWRAITVITNLMWLITWLSR